MINSFVKMNGFELFGTYENARGRKKTETLDRKMNQLAGEVVYLFAQSVYLAGELSLPLCSISCTEQVN